MMPPGLSVALSPLLDQIADMTVKIKEHQRVIKKLTETQPLIQVYGVDHPTALTYLQTLGKSDSSEAETWVVIWGCEQSAVNQAIAIRNSESPRPAMAICGHCWSSMPTMSSGHMERAQLYVGGVSAWRTRRKSRAQTSCRCRREKAGCSAPSHLDNTGSLSTVLCSRSLSEIDDC
jgi:hypothetical protein